MKAQQVKNTVIVPNGAKGGFVCKQLPAGDRDAIQREVVACYQTFIRGLLDVTDNIVDGKVVPPARVIRKDEDDPYLVVAADKGTATFSDIANALSAEYSHWLGDAFASGGSAGYDHKKMAITARGAWEAVKRHFRELGVDPHAQEFTVIGIGDMSGDVFGNGMLLSPHIKLVAAFDHRHIFVDPNPDPVKKHRGAPPAVRAAALELGRLRSQGVVPGRRDLLAPDEGDRAIARSAGPARSADSHGHASRADSRGAQSTRRSLLERRHRHLREGEHGVAPRRRRPRERCGARRRRRPALPRRRGRRQPRLHPARQNRVRARRRQDQHGLHRQLGRGGLLRPRGEHQDPARGRGSPEEVAARSAQRIARGDDRPDRGARARQQLRADAGALDDGLARRGAARRARAPHSRARSAGATRPRARVPADRGPDRGAPRVGPRAHAARARDHSELLEDPAARQPAADRHSGGSVPRGRARAVFPAGAIGTLQDADPPAPPAPRDHHDARRRQHDQSHGAVLRPPGRGGDRRERRASGARLRDRPGSVRRPQAVARDRSARSQG